MTNNTRTTRNCAITNGPSRELLRDSLGSPETNRISCNLSSCLKGDQETHRMLPTFENFNIRIIVNGLSRPGGTDDFWKVTGYVTEINGSTIRFKTEFEMEYRTDERKGNLILDLPADN